MVQPLFLEEIDGHWQGAAFVFRQGLQSGVIRVAFGSDDSLFVGMSARGWAGIGPDPYGLERIVWTGKVPYATGAWLWPNRLPSMALRLSCNKICCVWRPSSSW